MTDDPQRQRMVADQLVARGIRDKRVLAAFSKVPRHLFVPEDQRPHSYEDHPCSIGAGQTISQPYIVALMTEQLQLKPGSKVLEIGTGSGYQTAILAELASRVYSIERFPDLADRAAKVLSELGCANLEIRVGDGTNGWSEQAPFDNILAAAAAPVLPEPLLLQLADGGRMVIPIGSQKDQVLTLVTRTGGRIQAFDVCPCAFVPLIGAHGWKDGDVRDRE